MLNLFQVYRIKIAQSYSIDPLLLEIIHSADIIKDEFSEIIVNFFPLNSFVFEGRCRSLLLPYQTPPTKQPLKTTRKTEGKNHLKNQNPWEMEAVIIDMIFTHFGQLLLKHFSVV